jgi:hypothetical protein
MARARTPPPRASTTRSGRGRRARRALAVASCHTGAALWDRVPPRPSRADPGVGVGGTQPRHSGAGVPHAVSVCGACSWPTDTTPAAALDTLVTDRRRLRWSGCGQSWHSPVYGAGVPYGWTADGGPQPSDPFLVIVCRYLFAEEVTTHDRCPAHILLRYAQQRCAGAWPAVRWSVSGAGGTSRSEGWPGESRGSPGCCQVNPGVHHAVADRSQVHRGCDGQPAGSLYGGGVDTARSPGAGCHEPWTGPACPVISLYHLFVLGCG